MSKKFQIIINNKKYSAQEGQTILEVALENGLKIPAVCKHPDLDIQGKCRVCLVELEDGKLVTACSTLVRPGMKIELDTKSVKRARQVNLEMIYAEHIEKCEDCIQEKSCLLKDFAAEFGLDLVRYQDRKKDNPIWNFGGQGDLKAKARKHLSTESLNHENIKILKNKSIEMQKRLNTELFQQSFSDQEWRQQQQELFDQGFIQFDSSKCIDCGICTDVCRQKQSVDFYETVGKGYLTQTKPTDETDKDCTYCGQCIVHCPVGAIQGVPHWPQVEQFLKNKDKHNKILIAQIAPSVRVSIGEEFGMDYGEVVTGQLAASMRALGFEAAFDVTAGADFTTYEEARELIEWLGSGKPKPMITSCCPGWVKFVEFFYPEFLSHLTTTRSPHIITGILAKTYWADVIKRSAQDMVVVSIMPCVAKKREITLESHRVNLDWCVERMGLREHDIEARCFVRQNEMGDFTDSSIPAVDYVLTTREYAYLLKENRIDFKNLKPEKMDSPLGDYSGAGVIYGASGGVMESALRTADAFLQVKKKFGNLEPVLLGDKYSLNKKKLSRISNRRIEFKPVRGEQGIKQAVVSVGGMKLKVAVVNGLGNARKLIENIKIKKCSYDYVEVMACPLGCIGGGGQPVPVTAEIRRKRAAALYGIDNDAKIRAAHDNIALLKVYRDYFQGDEVFIEQLLHSQHQAGTRGGYANVFKSK